jgi:hypothetical protein
VRQSYEEAPTVTLSIGPLLARLMRPAGINAVLPPAEAVDEGVDRLTIEVSGTGLGGDYGSAGYCYTGAEVSGRMTLQSASGGAYQSDFRGRLSPPPRIVNCRGRVPLAAPFGNALIESTFLNEIGRLVRARYGDRAQYDYWMAVFGDQARRIKLKGLNGLGDVTDPRALQTLVDNLDLDDRWDIVVDALVKHGPDAEELLLQVLAPTPPATRYGDPPRAAAADALGLIGDARAKAALQTVFNEARTSVLVKAACAAALLRIGDQSMIDVLVRTLQNTEVGWIAVKLLGKSGDVRAVGPLVAYLRENATLDVFEALAKLTGERFGTSRNAWVDWWEKTGPR